LQDGDTFFQASAHAEFIYGTDDIKFNLHSRVSGSVLWQISQSYAELAILWYQHVPDITLSISRKQELVKSA